MSDILERGTVHHVIDGESVPSSNGRTFTTINPTTGATITQVSLADAEDVDRAVRAAKRAFDEAEWARIRPADRARTLRRFADLIEQNAPELAELDALDGGGPVGQREGDVAAAAEILNFAASLGEHTRGAVYSDETGYLSYSRRRPYGVVAAIAPWNFPFYFAVAKTAAALALGNAVVLKMAEQTPLSAVRYGELAIEAGIPAGILNVVNGDADTGRALVDHPGVSKVTFTGSTEVGRSIIRASAQEIKSVHLELGGKSADIVFADADIEQAVDGALFTSFANGGQICTSGSRLLLERSIYDSFLTAITARAEKLRVGDPFDTENDIGPLVSEAQLHRVEGLVERAVTAGARIATGGQRLSDPERASGYFFAPTLLTGVDPQSEIAQEEVFGPVTVVLPFDTEEEALRLANSVDYGLAATVWTTDLARAARVADALDVGIIWTNSPHHEAPHIPYEGHKRSGLGEDQGVEAIATFTQLTVNHIAYAGQRLGWGEH